MRRNAPFRRRAVLYIHGWNDYFFQTHLADFYDSLGFDFYAIDLRRYGRSLVGGQYAGYINQVEEYYEEVDAALEIIRSDHDLVSLNGHSTGGLVGVLYANDRPDTFETVMLNAPWLEIQASDFTRAVTKPVMATLSTANPVYSIPMSDNGFYRRSILASEDGEWEYDTNLKGDPAFKIRVGWFRAILAGHARVALGLDIDCPVLVMISKRHDFRNTWHEDLLKVDTVLDVERIESRVLCLGDNVTLIRIEDALHDVVLSAPPVRERVFTDLRRWLTGYLSIPSEG